MPPYAPKPAAGDGWPREDRIGDHGYNSPIAAPRMPVDKIRVGARHRKGVGDLEELAASISEVGLLHPPVVTSAGVLVAGARRLEACKRLGCAPRAPLCRNVIFSLSKRARARAQQTWRGA